jgi:hypothetical protein
MRLLALLLLCSCARTGFYTKGWYEACMERIGVELGDRSDPDWREADAVCRRRAKSDAVVEPDSTTICRNVFGTLQCEHYDHTK